MTRIVIDFQHTDINEPMPWPLGINDELVVTSGLGPDDGAILIGFGPRGHSRETGITRHPVDALNEPGALVGMTASFSKDGNLFEWDLPIRGIRVIEEQVS